MTRPLLAMLLGVLLTAGCGLGEITGRPSAEPRYEVSDLERFVLAQSDLPAGYRMTTDVSGASALTCTPASNAEARALADRINALGLEGCLARAFRKEQTGATRARNDPGGTAMLLDSKNHAVAAMDELRKGLADSIHTTTGASSTTE